MMLKVGGGVLHLSACPLVCIFISEQDAHLLHCSKEHLKAVCWAQIDATDNTLALSSGPMQVPQSISQLHKRMLPHCKLSEALTWPQYSSLCPAYLHVYRQAVGPTRREPMRPRLLGVRWRLFE